MKTLKRVAEIAYELAPRDYATDVVSYDGMSIELQPTGVRLDNDGSRLHWVSMHAPVWEIAHDGVGWRATSEADAGHVYRLADAGAPKGTFVSWLPVAGSGERIELNEGTAYELRWASNPESTRMALYLSSVD
ncbi:hypothetical protein Rhe02_55870 [Rhizocola hellebori]|uniref:Uncharacterized protein n=2 Tax=Rhizocola hellebori TaxID=1392758 RepID=A0A8J3QD96_9ACTN|nr:hypothetical protein Rhe02_55870 [Rhizocola hellebori]